MLEGKRGPEQKASSKAIFSVIESGDHAMLLQLKAFGKLDVNCRNDQGLTPIMVAVDKGNARFVRALSMWGADIKAVDNEGQSVMDHAITSGNKNMVMTIKILSAK